MNQKQAKRLRSLIRTFRDSGMPVEQAAQELAKVGFTLKQVRRAVRVVTR